MATVHLSTLGAKFAAFDPDLPESKRKESITVAETVQLQDSGICEDVQLGLQGTSWNSGPFSVRRKAGGYHFHQLLARSLCQTPKRS